MRQFKTTQMASFLNNVFNRLTVGFNSIQVSVYIYD